LLRLRREGDDGRSRPLNHSEAVGRARLLADHAYATLLRGAVAEPGSHAIGAGELVRPLADVRLALLEQVDSGRRERQPWAYALAEEPAVRHDFGRVRPLGYDHLPSADHRARGLPARSFLKGAPATARRQPARPHTWDASRWLSPRQQRRVELYAARPAHQRRCYFEQLGDGALAIFAGDSPLDPEAEALYELRLLPEPVAWPRVPLLTLLHDGHLSLDAVVFCVGPCEGEPSRKLASAPPAGIDRVDTLRRMDLSPLGLWAQLDDPLAFSECARHVLLLRAEDAMLATYCDDDVAGARPPRLRDYQLDEMARARVLPAKAARRLVRLRLAPVAARGGAARGWPRPVSGSKAACFVVVRICPRRYSAS